MSATPPLAVTGLSKRYGPVLALDGVDLAVAPGELVGLLGPNGAGKSTLVKIACGLVAPSSGRAVVAGAPAGSRAARRAVGYLAELFRFPGWCTATEVLALHQRLAGSTGAAREQAELLALVGLADATQRRVDGMSKGMQQRLGIAQALIGEPRLLLLDEPTSALDPAGRRDVRTMLEHLRDRGIAVLLNSHLLGEVEHVCDRVVILAGGRVAASGRRLPQGGRPGVTRWLVIARYALQESVRRRVFAIVVVLSVLFLALFTLATVEAFNASLSLGGRGGPIDANEVTSVTLVGLGMFAALFLCAAYVAALYAIVVVIVHQAGGAWPDHVAGPGLALIGAVCVIVALSLLGSVFLSATANGITMFMLYGAGLVSGLLSTIGAAIGAHTVRTIAHDLAIALPYEGLYQAALHALGSNQSGLTGVLVNLGPFGSSHAGGIGLDLWSVAYVAVVAVLATLAFARRDL
ncbi:MAG: ABC transporter ATP-binding protein [Solirubrobacteraceae bacterium]